MLDVFEHDPQFGRASAQLLEKLLPVGLAVSAVTMVELSAAFAGDIVEQKLFLEQAGISHAEAWKGDRHRGRASRLARLREKPANGEDS